MLFEVQDLAVASPATVSRCGMVYMDPILLGWKSYTKMWLRKLPVHFKKELKTILTEWLDVYVEECISFVRKEGGEYVTSVNLNLASTLCRFLSIFINNTAEIDYSKPAEDLRPLFGYIFIFSLIWAFGGNLKDGFHDAFDTFIKDLFQKYPIADVSIPSSSNNVFSYYVDLKRKCFSPWDDIVPSFKYSADIPYFDMIVPTVDTVKYTYLLEHMVLSGFPVLFTGQTGVGKSVVVQDYLKKAVKSKPLVNHRNKT
jgi:dynein heavy chain